MPEPDVLHCKLKLHDDKIVEFIDDNGSVWGEIEMDEMRDETIALLKRMVRYFDTEKYEEGRSATERDKALIFGKDDLKLFGKYLYRMLFDDTPRRELKESVRQRFETTYRNFQTDYHANPNAVMRLTLIFSPEVKTLHELPWEFLYMPGKPEGFFFAGQRTELVLTRHINQDKLPKYIQAERNLRVLVVHADPGGTFGKVDARDVIEEIEALKNRGVEVEKIDGDEATVSHVKERITQFEPEVVHFIGHGEANQIILLREPEDLAMEAAEKGWKDVVKARYVNADVVGGLFSDHQPYLVFLHACKGAAYGSTEAFTSIAQKLITARIRSVIAMQYQITNQDAKLFASTFYQELGKGRSVSAAVNQARNKLGSYDTSRSNWSDRRIGTPVIYVQDFSDYPLINLPVGQALEEETVEDSSEESRHRCPSCGIVLTPGVPRCTNPQCERRPRLRWCPRCGTVTFAKREECDHCEYVFEKEVDAVPRESASRAAPGTATPAGDGFGFNESGRTSTSLPGSGTSRFGGS